MALLSTISFELEIAPLQPKKKEGIPLAEISQEVQHSLPQLSGTHDGPSRYIPLGLRWRLKPEIGIPRRPFYVWRRPKALGDPVDYKYNAEQSSSFSLSDGRYRVSGGPFYVLFVQISNDDPVSAVTVQALNLTLNPILQQVVILPAQRSGTIRFQHPFIGGISIKGNYTLRSISGVSMKNIIGRKEEWELIQIVGLPTTSGETPGYKAEDQGYVNQLGDPVSNSNARVKIAQQYYLPLPTTLPSGMQVPSWDIPDPGEAIDEIRKGSPSLLERIGKMLDAVDNGQVQKQSDFRVVEKVKGIHQPQFATIKTADAKIDLPFLATVLINAVTDSWFSLSLGFGTTDFPFLSGPMLRVIEPISYFHVSHDYMVTSSFRFRYSGEVFTDPMYEEEYCALSHKSVIPTLPVSGLAASVFSLNRPPERDAQWSAEVALTWTKLNQFQIQGNAIVVAEPGFNGMYLNSIRPGANGQEQSLFIPMKPGNNSDPGLINKNRFIDAQTNLPFAGSHINRYGVASMDSFGRWSDWKETQLNLNARGPETPRLIALTLNPDRTRIVGNKCPHDLTLEVLWDWQDRSPKEIQFAAVFHKRLYLADGTKDNGHLPPATYPTIFQTDNTIAGGNLLQLIFPSDDPPGTAPVFTSVPTSMNTSALVELLPQSADQNGNNVEGEMRRYRITMKNISLSFQPDEEWYYTVFVKAAEWRNPALYSDSTPPLLTGRPPKLTAFVPNPIPAPPPVFDPADVIWAPLPDARGLSRFHLSFNKIPNATGGYAVFRAFEAKLRDVGGLNPVEGGDLINRATDLRDVVMPQERCADAFTRLNEKLIPPPAGPKVEYEVEIPGTIDGLVVFTVASVTREQETSAMSKPWLFVAVPRRSVPGLPLISIAQKNGVASFKCDFPKAPKPRAVEIYRTSREVLADDVNVMGQPVQEVVEGAWQLRDEKNRPVTDPALLHHFHFSVDIPLQASWFPYYFRASAPGINDPVNGLIAGRSLPSNIVKIEKLPATLPQLIDITAAQKSATTLLLTFKSDVLVEVTPSGNFRFDLFTFDFVSKQFLSIPTISILLRQAQKQIAVPAKDVLYYSDADAAGFRQFTHLMETSGEKYLYRVRVTDPLERSTEKMVSGDLNAPPAPSINDASVKQNLRDLLVYFESSSPFKAQQFGEYMLDITFRDQRNRRSRLLLRVALSDIPEGPLTKLRNSPVTAIVRDSAQPGLPARYGAIFKNFNPGFVIMPIPGSIRIQLTAPNNISVGVTLNLGR